MNPSEASAGGRTGASRLDEAWESWWEDGPREPALHPYVTVRKSFDAGYAVAEARVAELEAYKHELEADEPALCPLSRAIEAEQERKAAEARVAELERERDEALRMRETRREDVEAARDEWKARAHKSESRLIERSNRLQQATELFERLLGLPELTIRRTDLDEFGSVFRDIQSFLAGENDD